MLNFKDGIVARYVVGGTTTSFLFGENQISVDSSNNLPTIIKLQPINPSEPKCEFYVQDVGNNCSVGTITIIPSAGNLINGQTSLVLNTNGIGVEIAVTDQNNFIGNLSTDSQTSGLTGANNGLGVSGSNVQLGGTLNQPTVINALGVNVLSINDQVGLFFQTRDVNGNFLMNNVGGTGTLVNSGYVFSYIGDGGNVFTNTFIVVNFGGAVNITGGSDFWNFGDYTVSQDCFNVRNFGRSNQYYNDNNGFLFGNYNTTSSLGTFSVIGDYNVVSNGNTVFSAGHYNQLNGVTNAFVVGRDIYVGNGVGSSVGAYIFGHSVNIDAIIDPYGTGGNVFSFGSIFNIVGGNNVDAIVSLGFNNTINATQGTRGVYMFGDTHYVNEFATYSTLIGESCNFTRVDHTTTIGIFNNMTDVTFTYNLGEGNNYDNVTNVVSLGNYNTISSSYNLSVFGSGNNIIGENDKLILGNNNQNVVIDAISGNVAINQAIDVGSKLAITSTGFINAISTQADGGYAVQGIANTGVGVRGVNTTSYGIGVDGFSTNNVGVRGQSTNGVGGQFVAPLAIIGTGKVKFDALPLSPVGLVAGELWNNAGVVNIV